MLLRNIVLVTNVLCLRKKKCYNLHHTRSKSITATAISVYFINYKNNNNNEN